MSHYGNGKGKPKTRMLFRSFTFTDHEDLLFKPENICIVLEDNVTIFTTAL